MKKFDLIAALSERREEVIAKHANTTDGISLKAFMMEVVNIFKMNRIASQKNFDNNFDFLLGQVTSDHYMPFAASEKDNAIRRQYKGTAFMALV